MPDFLRMCLNDSTFAADFKVTTKMEKIALMVVAVMMATVSVNAQDDDLQNEIGVFYGFGSASNVVSTFTEAFSGAVGDQSSFWGPVGIEYFHHVTPVVSVGAMASFAGCNVSSKEGNSSFTERFITVMPAVKFNWLRKESFGMQEKRRSDLCLRRDA